jgi:hypothetical protein
VKNVKELRKADQFKRELVERIQKGNTSIGRNEAISMVNGVWMDFITRELEEVGEEEE